MNIIEEIEQEYRQAKGYGIKFSIEPEAYDCKLGDRVTFGDNTTEMCCGTFYNYQPILLDGVEIGFLKEAVSGKMFHPITTSFCVPLADCSEPEKITDEMRKSPHFEEGETYLMKFATINQMLEYLKSIKNMTTAIKEQFDVLKKKHPDALLLFRCGDFYMSYEEDAVACAQILGVTITKRFDNTKEAMFPFHALDAYLPKLIRYGKRVAICEQLEDHKLTKKLVKRGVKA